MKNTLFVVFITICLFSCKYKPVSLHTIKAEQIKNDSTVARDKIIEEFISPYRSKLQNELDTPIAYALGNFTKTDGLLESSMGNLMADIALEQTRDIMAKRFAKTVDFVLLNHGGIRAAIPAGNITARNAFEVMPFENELVAVTLSPDKMKALLKYLVTAKKSHPLANIKLQISKDDTLRNIRVNNALFDERKEYIVLTTDYLQQGGDNMTFFADPVELDLTDYKLRNAMIDYFKKKKIP
jgi:5'-nucleotidase